MSDWQCPTCGHVMTEVQSKGYIGCPTGFHFVQHVPYRRKTKTLLDKHELDAAQEAVLCSLQKASTVHDNETFEVAFLEAQLLLNTCWNTNYIPTRHADGSITWRNPMDDLPTLTPEAERLLRLTHDASPEEPVRTRINDLLQSCGKAPQIASGDAKPTQ